MAIQQFDVLNNYTYIPEKWFGDVPKPPKDKKKRINLAEDMAEILMLYFTILLEQEMQKQQYEDYLANRIKAVAENEIGVSSEYIDEWSKHKAKTINERTLRNIIENIVEDFEEDDETEEPAEEEEYIEIEELDIKVPKKKYWTSPERAMLIGIDLSTSLSNYINYVDAIDQGKTTKTWDSVNDNKVRDTHEEAHGQTVGIFDLFTVGESVMLFPGDSENGAEDKELINCRCSVSYQ